MNEALNMYSTKIYEHDQLLMIFLTHPLLDTTAILITCTCDPSPPIVHNQLTLVTHFFFQCCDPYYI